MLQVEREQEALLRLGAHGLDCLPQLVASGTVAEPSDLQASLLAFIVLARQLLLRVHEVLCTRQLAATQCGTSTHQPACAGPSSATLGGKLPGTMGCRAHRWSSLLYAANPCIVTRLTS